MSTDPVLPPGWVRATIGDLVSIDGVFCDGDWVESEDQDAAGDVRLIQLADVGDGEYRDRSSRFLTSEKAKELNCTFLEPGDVLIARMPDPLGRACIFPGDSKRAVTVVDVCIVRTKNSGVDHRWLQWFINAPRFRVAVAGLQSGSTRKRISRGNLSTLTLPVPPGAEQRRIVAKIEELFSDLDAGVAALERVRANLKRYRAAVLKAAVEGRLTEEWRKQHPPPHTEPAAKLLERILAERRAKWEQDQLRKFREAGKTPPKGWKEKYEPPSGPNEPRPADLPDTWSWCTIEQAAADLPRSIQSGPFGSNLLHSEFQDTGVLAIGIDNVLSGRFSLGSGHRISPAKFDELQKYEARPLDFLITVMATVGRCCVVPADLERAIITKHVYRVSLEPRLINSYFLQSAVLGGPVVKRQIFGEVRGQTRPGINGNILRLVAVPIPPLAEQSAIVAEVDRRLSVADAAEKQVDHALQRAARLRQSILKRAFEGKLVPQDPTDESAATMLERAKAPANGHRAVIETSDTPRRDTPKRRSRARA